MFSMVVRPWASALGVVLGFWELGFVSAQAPCRIGSAQDVLSCALGQHPDVALAAAQALRDEKLADVAKQRPNLELDQRILGGRIANDGMMSTETTLFAVVELGKKRTARVDLAQAELEGSAAQVRQRREVVALDTVLALHRLRQIDKESARVDEVMATFMKILRFYLSRPQLTPEQAVAKTSLKMAYEECQLEKAALRAEKSKLALFLELATGALYKDIEPYLPPTQATWPALAPAAELATSSYSALEHERLNQKQSNAAINAATALAWPDLKIGPTFESVSFSRDNRERSGGIGFALPLPILNRNQGQKAYAKAERVRADQALQLTMKKVSAERQEQTLRYAEAVRTLKETGSTDDLIAQHEKIESYFVRGLVPSTWIIETHRQLEDIARARDRLELTGLDALWRIYIIDGSVFEQKL